MKVFSRIRAYVYDSKQHCLFDSLVVIEYLAHYELSPTFVMAIQTDPFGAHAWVQEGDCVFNDRVVRTQYFSPIVVI